MARRKSDSSDESRKMGEDVRHWLAEITASRKREDEFRNNGKRIRGIFSGEKKESTPFNILYANTEIIAPSLYSMTPRPIVERRFKDNDPLGKAAAIAGQRGLEFLLDTNVDGYDTFNDSLKASVLDALLPGRGLTGVKYDADVDADDVKGYESVCTEITSWNKVYFGYAKKWAKVPWIAFEVDVDQEEAREKFGDKIADAMEFTSESEDQDDRKSEEARSDRKVATVYQIWDKEGGRKVRWVSRHYPEAYLKVEDDPLGLTGFFKIPRPLQFIEKTDDMIPTAMYTLYENQAEELNRLTIRINKIVSAMKARGAYDSALGTDIERIFDGDDNELIPTDKGASMAAERGLGNAIWFVPLEVLQQTLQQLYMAREQCKQVIYEIMGISDIVRGASKASETLGAQQIKSQWGTLRLKTKQAEVQRYARDLLRMMLEVAASKFSQDTWARMTGLPYLTDAQVEQMQMQMQAMQQQMMFEQQMAARTGKPPAPSPMQQQMQQLQAELQKPKWTDVLGLLNDDLQRSYRIDIETNSTIEPEAVEDQKAITELMNAIGMFTNGVGPMIQQGVLPFEVAKNMLLAISRRFRFGREIEDDIQAMQAPKPEDDGKEAAAQKQLQQSAQKQMATDAQLKETETKLTASQEHVKLLTREHTVAMAQQALDYDQKVFKLEQKVAVDSIAKNAKMESQSLDHKRQLAGAEAKNAGTERNLSKAVDTKMAESVKALQGIVESLVASSPAKMLEQLGQVAQVVAAQTQQVQELAKAVRAPKRKRAIRDPQTDRIVETIEETVQ